MGTYFEHNDTLRITKDQGFPKELVLEEHLKKPYQLEDFADKIFEFKGKRSIRLYHTPPVRNFLVEDRNGKWIYWGLIHIVEVTHDYVNNATSGKFKIIYLNSPEEMKKTFELVDRSEETRFFN